MTGNGDLKEAKAQATVADEIVMYACSLVEQINYLSDRVHDKLNPVMVEDCPRLCKGEEATCREYPPLFNELRSKFDDIKYKIEAIDSAINRCAL